MIICYNKTMSTITINRKNFLRDFANITSFVAAVVVGTLLFNAFVFRSYNVVGVSMEETLHSNERIIVNRLPITWAQIKNTDYIPTRGQIIVFENPKTLNAASADKYLVKRVIAFSGERVIVKNGQIKVYNEDFPDGFDPDVKAGIKDSPRSPVSGTIDMVVPQKTIFVVGDHRDGQNSNDSRNGLGTIPLYNVVGPVSIRWWPIHKLRLF